MDWTQCINFTSIQSPELSVLLLETCLSWVQKFFPSSSSLNCHDVVIAFGFFEDQFLTTVTVYKLVPWVIELALDYAQGFLNKLLSHLSQPHNFLEYET